MGGRVELGDDFRNVELWDSTEDDANLVAVNEASKSRSERVVSKFPKRKWIYTLSGDVRSRLEERKRGDSGDKWQHEQRKAHDELIKKSINQRGKMK